MWKGLIIIKAESAKASMYIGCEYENVHFVTFLIKYRPTKPILSIAMSIRRVIVAIITFM
jgi:hypothetical protein